jgi:DNA-directed RNA polymerase beta subunit
MPNGEWYNREGRAQGGGLRIGVQERDCILGQGASRFARDRLVEQSDDYRMWICIICGLPAIVDETRNIKECRLCGLNKVTKVRIPYGTKMIMQELMGMNIVPRLMVVPYE